MLCIYVKPEALREIMCQFDRGALNFIDHYKFRNFRKINWLCSKGITLVTGQYQHVIINL